MYSKYTFKTPLEDRPIFLNKFNPALKIVCAILLLVLVFMPVTIVGQLGILTLLVALWISARLPRRKLKPIFRTLLFLFVFIFLINWLVNKSPGIKFDLENKFNLWGSTWENLLIKNQINIYSQYYWKCGQVWGGWVANSLSTIKPVNFSYLQVASGDQTLYLYYSCPWYALSSIVLISSISMCIKLFGMLVVFSLLVNTTSTLQLTYGFEYILWPLKWIMVPVTEISYIIAVAIRFVPSLFEEANKIINAQASRGLDFRNGRFATKIKVLALLVVPMFSASFNQADQLSDAMEARNFDPGAKRTKYRVYHCLPSNWVSIAILLCLLALFIYFRVCKVIIYPFTLIDCFNI